MLMILGYHKLATEDDGIPDGDGGHHELAVKEDNWVPDGDGGHNEPAFEENDRVPNSAGRNEGRYKHSEPH